MSGITDFLDTPQESRSEKFLKVAKDQPKEVKRELEKKLLSPSSIPSYTGVQAAQSPIESRTVTMVFESDDDIELLKKWMKVADYKGLNVRASNLAILVEFLNTLERGSLVYEADSSKLFAANERGELSEL